MSSAILDGANSLLPVVNAIPQSFVAGDRRMKGVIQIDQSRPSKV
jgi:hypothetical protein